MRAVHYLLIVFMLLEAAKAQLRYPQSSLGSDNLLYNSTIGEYQNRVRSWQTIEDNGVKNQYIISISTSTTTICTAANSKTVCSDAADTALLAFDFNTTSSFASGKHYREDGSFFSSTSSINTCYKSDSSYATMLAARQLSFTTTSATGLNLAGDWYTFFTSTC